MTRKRLLIALVAIIAVAFGIRAVIRAQTGGPPRAASAGAARGMSPHWVPVSRGAPNTARAVIYRFASAYGEVSSATVATSCSAAIAARAVSKTTSYALPDSQRTASCCVAGIR